MKITAGAAINLKANLENFAQKQVPFALVLTKNLKKVEKIVEDFDTARQDLINEYAIFDEKGQFIPATKEDGTKYENPQTLNEIEVNNREELLEKIRELEVKEYEVEFDAIDTEKIYYDSKVGEKMKVSDFIDANLEPALIIYLNQFEIIKL